MEKFVGKWEIQKSDNFENYMIALGLYVRSTVKVIYGREKLRKKETPDVPKEKIAKALQYLSDDSKLTYEISNTGNDWEFTYVTPAGKRLLKFTLGVQFETTTLDERPIKATFTMDGDNLKEEQEGKEFKTTNIRVVDGDTMTMTMTAGNGVKCTRIYKKL